MLTTVTRASAAAALAMGVTLGTGGCGDSPGARSQPAASTSPTRTQAPLTITARYSEESLGVKDPRAMALGPDGNLYVTDRTDHVTVVSRTGHVLRRWGGLGRAPGQFRFVSSDPNDATDTHGRITVAIDGSVFVSDSGNFRVEEFTSSGRYVRSYGAPGNQPGQFLDPFDLVTDRNSNLYVTDDQLKTLTKLSPTGQVIWRVGGADSQDPDLAGHLHVSVIDAHGRLVLTNDEAGRIVLLDENGHKVDSFGSRDEITDSACDATLDRAGNVYTVRCGVGGGAIIDPAHHVVTQWSTIDGRTLITSPRFEPDGLGYAIASDGSLLAMRPTG